MHVSMTIIKSSNKHIGTTLKKMFDKFDHINKFFLDVGLLYELAAKGRTWPLFVAFCR